MTDFQIFAVVILLTVIVSWFSIFIWLTRAKTAPKKEEELPLASQHKILIGYDIANIWFEEGDLIFTYKQKTH